MDWVKLQSQNEKELLKNSVLKNVPEAKYRNQAKGKQDLLLQLGYRS